MRRARTICIAVLMGVLAAGCGAGDTSGSGRVIHHAMGETELDGIPERVVVLDTGLQDHLVQLGVRPVGATEPVAGEGFISYLEPELSDTENLGFVREPSLELIATLEPDLILGSQDFNEAIYEQLSEIAPTIFVEDAFAWRENLFVVADALGKTSEAEEIDRAYEAQIAAFKEEMGERLDQLEVSYIRAALDTLYIYHRTSFAGSVLEDLGVRRPPAQDLESPPAFAEAVGPERLKDVDGDAIFISTYGAEGPDTLDAFTSDPLWNQLNAVQQDHVYEVDDEMWAVAIGYTAAEAIMNDLRTHLAK